MLINSALKAMFDDDPPITYFDAHGRLIYGSRAQRKPDVEAFASSPDFPNTLEHLKAYWPMVVVWLEVKRVRQRNGYVLDWTGGTGIDIDESQTKRPSPLKGDEVATDTSPNQPTDSSVQTGQKRKRGNAGDNEKPSTLQNGPSVPAKLPLHASASISASHNSEGTPNKKAKSDITHDVHDLQIQLAGYGLEMLSSGLLRHHNVGIAVDGTCFQLTYYDRSKVVLSQPVNMDEGKNLLLFLALLYKLGTLYDRKSPSVPPFTADENHFPRIDPVCNSGYGDFEELQARQPKGLVHNRNSEFPGANAFHSSKLYLDERTTVQLQEILHRAYSIIGRGTTVIKAKRIKGRWDERIQDVVVKISFPGAERPPEQVLVEEARNAAVGNHIWALNHLPEILSYHEYDLDKNTPQPRLAKYLTDALGEGAYERRVLRILVLRPLCPITHLKEPGLYAQVFYDILQIHRWLIDHAKIFHRDISMANIMFVRKDGAVCGILNDFDLAARLPLPMKRYSQQRTGTKPYMSHDLLDPVSQRFYRGHTYRHDLESLFYVVLILTSHYNGNLDQESIHGVAMVPMPYFHDWFTSTNVAVAEKKSKLLQHPDAFPTQNFFKGFREKLLTMLGCLVKGHSQKAQQIINESLEGLKDSTRPGHESDEDLDENSEPVSDVDFDWLTLNKTITYENFKRIMGKFARTPLVERYLDHFLRPLDPADFEPARLKGDGNAGKMEGYAARNQGD
ncbi:hypothetical protein D9758_016495 [Tetrapyrgos nigripes]|uniref:Protein kinase domain-containing protein n=1 Tax=Tetrapyrgos nigripes TaxID=182062 RepID=A0A8H5CME3_9AGAR|nr:hypothetical protein D9758_016495 [Tetrapyrgos nigripes]